jgi:thiol-disulfide isomerase/thioredoxin
MAPVVDRLAKEYEGTVEFKLYDVEKDQAGSELASEFRVQYVPTFVFVNKDGTIDATIVGEAAESDLRDKLDALQ